MPHFVNRVKQHWY